MGVLTLVVTYLIRPGHEAEAESFLRELIDASRLEPGCRTYTVHRSLEHPRTFLIYEQYDDFVALEAHRQTAHFQRCGKNGLMTIMEQRVAATYEEFA